MLLADAALAVGLTPQALHNKIKRAQIDVNKSKNRIYFGHEVSKKILDIEFKPQILSFQIVKGGTGKTSMCLSVGVRACLYGAKTLLVDLDSQANLTKACGIVAKNKPIMHDVINQDLRFEDAILNVCDGLDIFPSRIENIVLDTKIMLNRHPLERLYKDMLEPLKEKYDLILIDCPPALGCSVTAATLASDKIIAPVTPSEFSLDGLGITADEMGNIEKHFKTNINLYALLNEYDTRTTLSSDTLRLLLSSTRFANKVLRAVVRKSQEFENSLVKRITIFDSLNNNSAKEDIDLLTRELLNIGPVANLEAITSDANKQDALQQSQE